MFFQGYTENFAAVIQKQYMSFIFRVPQIVPFGRSFFDIFFVIDDTGDAGGIRQGIFAGRVKGQLAQVSTDVFCIGDLGKIQFFQHIQLAHGSYHIVGRHDDIKLGSACLHFSQQFFIVRKNVIGDFAVVLLFKIRYNIGIKIICPPVKVQDLGRSGIFS